jgi:CBS domain-containing protein
VPVVDEENRLQGIVTVDDAIDTVAPASWRRRQPRVYDRPDRDDDSGRSDTGPRRRGGGGESGGARDDAPLGVGR